MITGRVISVGDIDFDHAVVSGIVVEVSPENLNAMKENVLCQDVTIALSSSVLFGGVIEHTTEYQGNLGSGRVTGSILLSLPVMPEVKTGETWALVKVA